MPVILAEKPSQAKAYAEAFPKGSKKEGFIIIPACSVFPNGALLTWGVGHLVELRSPAEYESSWKRWNLSQLPMIPNTFKFKPSYKTRKQFQIVRRLLQETNEIIIATDCDREGENIARSIIYHAGAGNKPTRRLWINSLEKDEVKKGFEQLHQADQYVTLYEEAQARQISDWVVGMNASRLYTLLLQKKGIQQVFSVGRVQTPTLKLIHERQKEIEEFTPEPFFEVKAQFKTDKGSYEGKTKKRYKTNEEAKNVLDKHGIASKDRGEVKEVNVSQKRVKPPKLHSLSTLQTLANKKYKYSPSKTLEIVQSLYDQPLKLVTYPRTDTQHITKNEFAYIQKNLCSYQKLTGYMFEPSSLQPKKRYVDDSKVKEHYAIIPTKKVPTETAIQKLRTDQKNIYFEIVKSVLAMFHYDYEFEETNVITDVKGLNFYSKGKVEKARGWKELFDSGVTKQKQGKQQLPELPPVHKGLQADAFIHIKKEMTKPPKPYTEGQLINMMKTCGQVIEDDEETKAVLKEAEGLGTEATRSGIIKTLIRQEYIEVKKNIVSVTKKGEILCKAVEGTLLSKPEMTAKWEMFLKKIGQGEAQKQTFISNTAAFTKKLVDSAPLEVDSLKVSAEGLPAQKRNFRKKTANGPIALCPACKKGNIVHRQSFYGCTEYKNGCRQTFNKTILGKGITPSQIKQLCEKGETRLIKGFKGKKLFDAKLVLKHNKVEFSFPSST
ncbi:type IA DNA topoisomerase [Alteribacillus bidgolensis]|uniref:DNA topoisomerase n=1 Tax=Alteribacillus bidgolensis TaxID=930129 RepID=A0A1G8ILB7_9BACI|nr:type IA DNA topoisomerase [Alteribacillus bidgolensis]SDI19310.1 DNA topoisomerase-3 [Alteribacillus bidgolensis]